MADLVLAIDTALNGCGIAILLPEKGALAREIVPMTRGHAEALLPLVGEMLTQAGVSYHDISLIAVTVGPGAFTGLRIGLATAQALGLALGVPVAGVTTTSVLAAQFKQAEELYDGESLAIVLETKRADFYVEFFGAHAAPPAAMPLAELQMAASGPVRVIGDGLPRLRATGLPPGWVAVDGFMHPDPAVLASLAWEDVQAGHPGTARPLYLRPPDVTASTKPQRRLAERH